MDKMGSYVPFMSGKRVTYFYDYDKQLGWLIYEQKEGEEKTIAIPSKVIRELLEYIDCVETAWEDAVGEDL